MSKSNWLKDYLDNYESKTEVKMSKIKTEKNVAKSARHKKIRSSKLVKREKSNLNKSHNFFNRAHLDKDNMGVDGDAEDNDNYENTDKLEENKNLRDELNAMFASKTSSIKLGNSGKMVKAANNSSTCLLS